MFTPVPPDTDFVALEQAELARWATHRVFERSVEQRKGAPEWVFYEGPPTANGMPGLHHVWARVYKDLFCRFHAMRGSYVARRGGWDAAGVPTLDHYLKLGSWFAGTPDDLVAHLKSFEERYPGMQHINLSPPLTTPKDRIVEQYRMVGELVMPHFRPRPAMQAAAAQ